MAKKKIKNTAKNLWNEFKAFINKGNALMLAVGVVIGSGFSAIVNGVTNILLNLVTCAVPGGLSGLVTPLFTPNAIAQAEAAGITKADMVLNSKEFLAIEDAALRGLYTLKGGSYYYNGLPTLDWGTLINAVISFLIIALVLFIIVKVINYMGKKNAELQAKALEAYYQKHPEERPQVAAPEEPKPTELDVLTEIRDLLAKQDKK